MKIQIAITQHIFDRFGWMTYRWISCAKCFRIMYNFSLVTGHDPGRDWTTRLWPGPKFFWCHRIEHPKKPRKHILHYKFILYRHQIMLVQSFRAFHHSPGHNSAEPGSILINLVSLESWSIALQFGPSYFYICILFNCRKIQKHPKMTIFEFGGL